MSRYSIKFPFRVRIHGGEFDESARAIHREDGLKTIQAESGIVLESTIERKQMSTKTTFKRIALVTVAALGFGLMSVAPSSADNAILKFKSGDGVAATDPFKNGNGVAGAFNYVTLETVAPAADYVVTTDSTFGTVTASTAAVVASDKKSFSATVAATAIQVMTPTAGTVTVSYWVRTNGVLAATAAESVTITVSAAAQSGTVSAANSTSYLVKGESTTAQTDVVAAADVAVTASATAATTAAVATIKVSVKDSLKASANDSLTATITSPTGAGSIVSKAIGSTPAVNGSTAATSDAADAAGKHNFYVYANGFAGIATITIKAGTTVVATETVTFVGAPDAYTVAASATTAPGANIGVADTAAFKVTAKDSAGNLVVDGTTIYAVSGTPANATVTASATTTDGIASFTVTGVLSGDSVITFGNAATVATMTKSVTKTVSVVKTTFKTLTVAFDKEIYEPGEKMTLTFTAKDSNGKGIADGSRSILNAGNGTTILAAGFNVGVVGVGTACPTTTATFLAGVSTCVVYAPAAGKVVFSGSTGTADDAVVTLATAVTAVSASASVINASLTAAQEATDAANEATDAGNNAKDAADQAIEAADAATIAAQDAAAAAEAAGAMAVEAAEAAGAIAQDALDAANAATDAALSAAEAADAATAAATEAKESADAATAAVAELSTKVAALMAALNAKVTTLSNLVAKIAKKVKA